jgi:hypothetical protein
MYTLLCNATGKCTYKQNNKIFKERKAMTENMTLSMGCMQEKQGNPEM